MDDFYTSRLQSRKEKGLYRTLKIIPPGFTDFSSNDYLGYARLINAGTIPAVTNTAGSTGSRLICGNHSEHEVTEKSIAAIFNAEAALLYSSGYMANIGLISCIATRNDIILYDEYVHASMRDGIKLSNASAFSFAHNDLTALENLIQKYTGKRIIVLMESLYSMTGTSPDFNLIKSLQDTYTFELVLDEAHAAGVCGDGFNGYGPQLSSVGLSRIITFGKAFGFQGAAVLSSELLRAYQINFSRPFIYHTSMPAADAALINNILNFHRQHNDAQLDLQHNIDFFLQHAKMVDKNISRNDGPIQYLYLGNNHAAIEAEKRLVTEKITVKAIRYPTVPLTHAGLRICLHSYNTETEIKKLLSLLG